MKYISIITGSDLRFVMGVNYYIKSFIECNEYFEDVKVNRVYSGAQTLKIDQGDPMPIGLGRDTTNYKIRQRIRIFLRKLLTDKFYPFALFRYNTNLHSVSRRAVEKFFSEKPPCDYIIFQETGVAEYYFKNLHNHPDLNGIKTLYVLHSADDTGQSLLMQFKGYGRIDMARRINKRRDYVYSKVDRVVYISKKALSDSVAPIEKRICVYNGSPVINYGFKSERSKRAEFVCVGNLSGGKGQEKVLEAMSLLPKNVLNRIHFTIVGGGQNANEIKRLSMSLGLEEHVTFLGVRNDVASILEKMDVFIMPSKTEGLSMSAIEALRAGLYLVLTDTGGNAELCSDGCGVLCTRDANNIASIIMTILEDNVISLSQKERCHNHFLSHFSLETMAKGYEKELISL